MKTNLRYIPLFLAFLAFVLAGCSKPSENKSTQGPAADPNIEAMTGQALSGLGSQEVYEGEPETGLFMDNEGVPAVFMAEETDLDGNDPLRAAIRMHALIRCLKSIGMDESQAQQVRVSLHDYKVCKENAVKRAKAIYRDLQATYKAKYGQLYRKYKAGEITEREFKKLVEQLRIAFKRELHALHLKEKLDQAFAKCFRILLGNLKSILSENQWITFKTCFSNP